MPNRFGGVGVTLPLNQLGTNGLSLQAGQVVYVPPGYYSLRHGTNSSVQTFDPVMNVWRPCGSDPGSWQQVDSDGNNYRIANQSGCAVACLLTNAGTGYTSAPTVTASAGGSKWTAIMGQVISTTITVTAPGSNYLYPPIVIISAPAGPGITATAKANLTTGTVSSITVIDQGAGYTSPATISLVNDPRDTNPGSGAAAITTLTGAGTVTAVICTDHGTPLAALPTLAFAGGGGASAAATVIMDRSVQAYVVGGGGAGYTGNVVVSTIGTGTPTTATAYTNPNSQASFLRYRPAQILGALSAGAITATGQVLQDGGSIGGIASNIGFATYGGVVGTVATLTFTVGGADDFLWMQAG
jgi:hypothetical protein